MKTKISILFLALVLALTSTALSEDRPTESAGQYIGATSSQPSDCLLGGADVVGEPLYGAVLGCTYYDFQKPGSLGRQIVADNLFGILNFTWTGIDSRNSTSNRNVQYSSYPADGWWDDGVDVAGSSNDPNSRSLFPTMTSRGDGTILHAHNWNRQYQSDWRLYRTYVFNNETPGLPDFSGFGGVSGTGLLPDSAWNGYLSGDAQTFLWPQIAYTNNGGTQVAHLVVVSDRFDGEKTALYLRRVGTADWETVMELGPAKYYLSFIVTSSQNSERVAIAFSGARGDGTPTGAPISRSGDEESVKHDNDLYVIISQDAGATWGALQNITQRPDDSPGGFAPHAKLSAVFDESDLYHVVWQATPWVGYGGEFTTSSRMYHWDDNTQTIRIAADGVWTPTDCEPEYQQLNIDNPQLSYCSSRLYLTYTMFAPVPLGMGDDCDVRTYSEDPIGAANGNLYLSVSDNAGFNWDAPRALLDKYTPDCGALTGTPGPDCVSTTLHSTTENGIDVTPNNYAAIPDFTSRLDATWPTDVGDYLFTQYVHDHHPGGFDWRWYTLSNNPVRIFRFACVDKVLAPLLASSLPEGETVADPASVTPGIDSTINWNLTNIGNTPLTYTITVINDLPAGNVTVSSSAGTLDYGANNFEDITLTLNALNQTTPQTAHADIIIDGNFVGAPKTFTIDYCICDMQAITRDTLAELLVFDNRGNIGAKSSPLVSMDLVGNPAECDSTATSYLFEGSPIVSYPGDGSNITVSAMYNEGFVDSFIFRPLTNPSTDDSDPNWSYGHSGNFTTQDSVLGLFVEYWTPKTETMSGWEVVYTRVAYHNRTDTTLQDVYCAYAADWNVPGDSMLNYSGILATGGLNTIYQQGIEFFTDTSLQSCLNGYQRFAGLKYITPAEMDFLPSWSTTNSGQMSLGFQSMFTNTVDQFVQSDWNYVALDSIIRTCYDYCNGWWNQDPALLSGWDLFMLINSGKYNIDPNDTLYLPIVLFSGISNDNTTDDLVALGNLIPSSMPFSWHDPSCCDTPGDANNSGAYNIGDITFLIARIFAGGSAPVCCEEGDCNCDGQITIADVVCLINPIFGMGPQPTCCAVGHICQ